MLQCRPSDCKCPEVQLCWVLAASEAVPDRMCQLSLGEEGAASQSTYFEQGA